MNFRKEVYVAIFSVSSCFPLYTFPASDGFHSETFYDAGKVKQVILTKYSAGQLESLQEFNGEVSDGIYESWWRNGARKYKAFFVKGKANGVVSYWYKSGGIQFIGEMKNDSLDGELTTWFENGNERTKENYELGKKTGVWISLHENKNKSSMLKFSSGKILKCTSWDSEGKVIYTGSEKEKCESIFNSNYTMPLESEDPEGK